MVSRHNLFECSGDIICAIFGRHKMCERSDGINFASNQSTHAVRVVGRLKLGVSSVYIKFASDRISNRVLNYRKEEVSSTRSVDISVCYVVEQRT
jgi:hypothetical protein